MAGVKELKELPFDRPGAVRYARRWALDRNPAYYDFERIGGDCTNFASQCLLAGSGVMNWTPVTGWYYAGPASRSASWTGVEFLFRFLTENKGPGPWAVPAGREELEPGDLVQLSFEGGVYSHCPVVLERRGGEILLAAHSFDALDRPLSSYSYARARYLHILGVRR